MTLSSDNEETGISLWGFIAAAALVVIAAFAAVWFMFPGPDTRHDLVSPSGAARLELGELCGDSGCTRVAIFDSSGERRSCPLTLAGNDPQFAEVTATWSAEETSVTLDHVAADGARGSLSIALENCTSAP